MLLLTSQGSWWNLKTAICICLCAILTHTTGFFLLSLIRIKFLHLKFTFFLLKSCIYDRASSLDHLWSGQPDHNPGPAHMTIYDRASPLDHLWSGQFTWTFMIEPAHLTIYDRAISLDHLWSGHLIWPFMIGPAHLTIYNRTYYWNFVSWSWTYFCCNVLTVRLCIFSTLT